MSWGSPSPKVAVPSSGKNIQLQRFNSHALFRAESIDVAAQDDLEHIEEREEEEEKDEGLNFNKNENAVGGGFGDFDRDVHSLDGEDNPGSKSGSGRRRRRSSIVENDAARNHAHRALATAVRRNQCPHRSVASSLSIGKL